MLWKSAVWPTVLALLASGSAWAQCTTYTFEDHATGYVVKPGDYLGVKFTAPSPDGTCVGDPMIGMLPGGTSSTSHSLTTRAGPGCEFSPEFLRMTFDKPQRDVSFTVGPACGTYSIRAYDTAQGGTPISTQSFTFGDCTTWIGVHRLVNVHSPSGNIARIEVANQFDLPEAIDDLQFGFDDTPPLVDMIEPLSREFGCDFIPIMGTVSDPDGRYVGDRLEYRHEDDTDWTHFDHAIGPRTGMLYMWTSIFMDRGGHYYIRLTGINECGMEASDETVVYIDKSEPMVDLRGPSEGAVVGGMVRIDGSVLDGEGTSNPCLSFYTVEHVMGGVIAPVDPLHPQYTEPVINDPIALWQTSTGSGWVCDGAFTIRVTAEDECEQTTIVDRSVIVDNTWPDANIASPEECMVVTGEVPIIGTAFDDNISHWTLEWYDPYGDFTSTGEPGWAPISAGTQNMVSAELGVWDTGMLPHCAFTVRLRTWDRAIVDGDPENAHMSQDFAVVQIGECATFDSDCDGDIDLVDFGAFELAVWDF